MVQFFECSFLGVVFCTSLFLRIFAKVRRLAYFWQQPFRFCSITRFAPFGKSSRIFVARSPLASLVGRYGTLPPLLALGQAVLFGAVVVPHVSRPALCDRFCDWSRARVSSGDALLLASTVVHLQLVTRARTLRRRSGITVYSR